jgi:hypothetical protein
MGADAPPPALSSPSSKQSHPPSVGPVVLAFVEAGEQQLSSVPGLSIGLMSATQGAYFREQFLLDVTQGARVAASAYDRPEPPRLSLQALGGGGRLTGWNAVLKRAEQAPQLLRPGLLASRVAGGAAYAGIDRSSDLDAIVAAGREGRVVEISLGSAATLPARIARLRASHRLVVADLPAGAAGIRQLRALSRQRPASELLLVVQRAVSRSGHELLWAGAAGLPAGGGHELTSRTTNQRGLIASVDLAATILAHLGVQSLPADLRGEPLETDGPLHSAELRAFAARLRVVGGRRLPAFGCILSIWALLLLACSLPRGRRARRARSWAMRVGALAVLWIPVGALLSAALEPSAALEYLTITLSCFVLATLADALIAWPRAPIAPAVVGVIALVVDALAGTQLLVRSPLGPNPILGARFYGFGNELKSGLAVAVLAALAGALYPSVRSRRGAALIAAAGVVLAAIEGSARIGAGVGGVILVAAGFAVAAIVLLPGSFSRARALLVLSSPLLALLALAALDLATAHGTGHFTGSVLHARSAADVRDLIERRYGAAWVELKNHAMPFAAALALIYGALAIRLRHRLLAPVGEDPAWLAALAGGLTAGLVGTFSVAVFTLGCVATYLWGGAQGRAGGSLPPRSGRAGRADARTRSTVQASRIEA